MSATHGDSAPLSTEQQRIRELEEEVDRLKRTLDEQEVLHRQTMGRYVTTEVMETLSSAANSTIAGERRLVTMMFTDLRGSTELSEKMDPEEYIRLLNHYLQDMIFIIDTWHGNILEFVGDSIVCIFGAPRENPDAAAEAVCSAIAMQRHMTKVNEWNRSQGYPSIEMGIAIHTGEAIVGCIGSETRMKYDVIGRNMNLASRAEGYAKGGQILVTDETLAAAGSEVIERSKGAMHVKPKGVRNKIWLHDVIGMGSLTIE